MVHDLTPYEALNLAVERIGSQAKLAQVCGVSANAVGKWVHSSKRLPPEYALRVEAKTGVSRTALCPSIYPRGLVDGMPYDPEEPLLDVFTSVTVPPRRIERDIRASDPDARFQGVDRRTGAQN